MPEKFKPSKKEQEEDFTQGLDYPNENEAGFEGMASGINPDQVDENNIVKQNNRIPQNSIEYTLAYLGDEMFKNDKYPNYIHLPNAINKLLELRREDLAKKVFQAFLKRAIVESIETAQKIVNDNVNELLVDNSLFKVMHLPEHATRYGVKVGEKSDAYKILCIYLSKIYEACDNFRMAERISSDAGDVVNKKRLSKLIKPLDDQNNRKRDDEMIVLASAQFIKEINDNPILTINDKMILDEVKKEIKQKLTEV